MGYKRVLILWTCFPDVLLFSEQFCKSSVGKRDNGNAYNVTMVTDSDLSTEMDDNFNNDKKMCTECCDGDLCNNKGCGEPGGIL